MSLVGRLALVNFSLVRLQKNPTVEVIFYVIESRKHLKLFSLMSVQHSKSVHELLDLLQQDQNSMLLMAQNLFGEPGAPMFGLDILAYGAIKRNLSTTQAIAQLVLAWNMVSARSLLRVHIDTALRFSAAWFVERPHDFALKVVGGHRIDKLKDRSGVRFSDAQLVEMHSAEYPWLPKVYENLSGYIHFSKSHIFDSVIAPIGDDMNITFELSTTDTKFPEFSWIEILKCTRDATRMLSKYLDGYILTKGLSPEQLSKIRKTGAPT